jgi:general secretion pathway protein N
MVQPTRKQGATLALLLATALGAPASTLALPTDAPDADLNAPRRADAPAVSSVWDQPATPSPVMIVRPPQPSPAAPERTPSANPLWEIPLASLSNTRERPIFSPSRRPPPAAVAATPPAKEPPPPKSPRVEHPQLSLVGTVGGDDESFGIFVDQTTKAALRLKIGEDYQGWKLRSVQGREVTLQRDTQSAVLSLPQPGAAAPGPLRLRPESGTAPRSAEPTPQRDERR